LLEILDWEGIELLLLVVWVTGKVAPNLADGELNPDKPLDSPDSEALLSIFTCDCLAKLK
jgi:hypothetical protein